MKLPRFAAPLLVTLVCTLVSGADDSVIFSDNFSTLDPGWGQPDDVESVSGNKLVVTLGPDLVHHNFYEGRTFDLASADIRLNVTEVKGGTDQPAGLVFWAVDVDNYYAAFLQADGTFYVARKTFGQWLNPVPVQTRSEVQKGLGQVNAVRVVTNGKSVTVYINEKQVAAFKGFPPPGESMVGIHAESGDDSFTWAFSELSVRKGLAMPEATSSQDDNVLFADDFSTLDPAWCETNDRQSVSGNKLILKPQLNKSIGFLYSGCLFGEADIRVKVTEIEGGTDSPGGLLFWASDIDNLYSVYVQSDGEFFIGHKVDGKWINPVPLEPRSEVQKGLGQANELRVVTSKDSATFYVNDHQIAKISRYKHPDQSMIGLQVESDVAAYTWAISDLVVRKPQ